MSGTIDAEFRVGSPRWTPAVVEVDTKNGRVLVAIEDRSTLAELVLDADEARRLSDHLVFAASSADFDEDEDED